jgi:predicted nucleic acid-binding Zn ribbon protein
MNPKIRARAIAEWRGLPEPAPPREARPLSDALLKVMSALGLGDRLREEEMKNAWKEIVGDFLATHSQPTNVQDGRLIVRVLQPTLLYEFDRNLKRDILQKLRARFGPRMIREIKFRIG